MTSKTFCDGCGSEIPPTQVIEVTIQSEPDGRTEPSRLDACSSNCVLQAIRGFYGEDVA